MMASKTLLVVNMRGTINISSRVKQTLNEFHLTGRFRSALIPDNAVNQGMLRVVKDRVSWCKIGQEDIAKLLQSRAKKEGSRNLTSDDFRQLGYPDIMELAKAIEEGKISLQESSSIRPFFTLNSPKGGFKRSIRRLYAQGGILGENPDLPKLVRSML